MLKQLKNEFGEQLDWYGRGVRPAADKWDAFAPYRYHLVFENGQWPDYWTEKLADAYLGFAMPVYVGCKNIQEYFPKESLVVLDEMNPAYVLKKLMGLLEHDAYTKSFEQIIEARNMLLCEYSFFNMLIKMINEDFNKGSVNYKTIRFSEFSNIAYIYNPKKLLKRILSTAKNKKF